VMLGTSDSAKLTEWKEKGGERAHIGTFEEAAHFGNIIVLSVKGVHACEAIEKAGPQNLLGKTVIDVTNPIAELPPEDGVLHLFTNSDESLMERLQLQFPGSHFVKAFSCVGSHLMVNPALTERPTMFICGTNENAKNEVKKILDMFGWDIADMGKVTAARAIEPLCMLWCIPGFLNNSWVHAFKLVRG